MHLGHLEQRRAGTGARLHRDIHAERARTRNRSDLQHLSPAECILVWRRSDARHGSVATELRQRAMDSQTRDATRRPGRDPLRRSRWMALRTRRRQPRHSLRLPAGWRAERNIPRAAPGDSLSALEPERCHLGPRTAAGCACRGGPGLRGRDVQQRIFHELRRPGGGH